MLKVNICGINVDNLFFDEAVNKISFLVQEKMPVHVVTPNIDHIVRTGHDREFKQVYDKAPLILADGMPLLWAGKFLGTPLKEKISGSDLFPKLCDVAVVKGYRLFFLGGREGSAEKAADVLRKKYPGIYIVGIYYPPFGFENEPQENAKIIKAIKEAKPDILFVGVGSPKQEKWIYKHKDEYQVPVSIGIGVTFDFVSGMVKRAPFWMQKAGFEWLWRIMMEPRRLWKRYLIDDMFFFWLVFKQRFNKV